MRGRLSSPSQNDFKMKKGKKKEIVKRNIVNRMMCEDHRFRTKVFKNKKKELKKFDYRKEIEHNERGQKCSSFLFMNY